MTKINPFLKIFVKLYHLKIRWIGDRDFYVSDFNRKNEKKIPCIECGALFRTQRSYDFAIPTIYKKRNYYVEYFPETSVVGLEWFEMNPSYTTTCRECQCNKLDQARKSKYKQKGKWKIIPHNTYFKVPRKKLFTFNPASSEKDHWNYNPWNNNKTKGSTMIIRDGVTK